MAENASQALKTLAYLHPVSDQCVTTDPTAYLKSRELVSKAQAQEQIADLREGLEQWRAIAVEAIALAARLKSSGALWGPLALGAADRQALVRLAAWQDIDTKIESSANAEAAQAGETPSSPTLADEQSLMENLAIVHDYVGRTTHWTEGRPSRHDAIESLKKIPGQIEMLVDCSNIGQDEQGWFALRVAAPGRKNRLGRGPSAWAAVQDAHQHPAPTEAQHG